MFKNTYSEVSLTPSLHFSSELSTFQKLPYDSIEMKIIHAEFFQLICSFQAEEKLASENQDKEYAPISGIPEFCSQSIRLALGEDNAYIKNGAVSSLFGHPIFYLRLANMY